MSRGIFGRIFILYVVVSVLGLLFAEIYITDVVRESFINNLKKSLTAQAKLVSQTIPLEAGTEASARNLKETLGARVTIIEPDGKVVADSDQSAALMDNHARRPEVMQALHAGTGSSIRYSDTLKYDFLYTAVTVAKDGMTAGFVRLAVPLTEVNRAVNGLRLKLFLAVSLVILAIGLFQIWQTGRLKMLTAQVAEFSGAIVSGDFGKRLFFKGMGEFSDIAENLNAMSEELKSTIEESEKEKNRLNVILKSIPDALLIIDPKDTIVLSSAASSEIFGGASVTGRPYVEVVRSHEFTSLVDEVRRSLKPEEREITLDYPVTSHLSVRVSPLFFGEGDLSGYVAIFHDITRLKKLEEVRKDFVANVSHEIRTPISSIKGYSETLLDGALDDKENARRFLQTIKSNSERLNSLVEDLLTISRLELGAITVKKAQVDVRGIVGDIVAILGGKTERKGLMLETSIKEGVREISADRDRLLQILTNLVDNAIKFTESGTVTLGAHEEDGRTVLFVKDTGVGVPRKYLPRLGERFFRVDPSRSRAMGGTGLGLAIVKHLVRAHGWNMQIDSAEGKGTTVKIIINP